MTLVSTKSKNEKTSKFKKEYILIGILVVLLALTFIIPDSFDLFNSVNSSDATENYQDELECKLESMLSELEGVGKVKVMVTLSGTGSEEVAKNVEIVKENGVETKTETVVLISGKPYVLKTNNPEIFGIVVIAEGGDDVKVKMNITEVITTALGVYSDKIRILKMK